MEGEVWRPVVGWEGVYEVSDLGRMKSLPRHRVPGGVLRPKIAKRGGYPVVTLKDGDRLADRPVHQLVLEAFEGPRPDGDTQARHLDGDPANNAAVNLTWGTRGENQLDSVQHGTHNNARKKRCPQDHEYTPENTYELPAGGRVCRKCADRRRTEWELANR